MDDSEGFCIASTGGDDCNGCEHLNECRAGAFPACDEIRVVYNPALMEGVR